MHVKEGRGDVGCAAHKRRLWLWQESRISELEEELDAASELLRKVTVVAND